MIPFPTFWFPLFLGLALVGPAGSVTVTRLIVRDEVVWRVPVVPPRPLPRIHWKETKGPKCIPATAMVAAALADESSVDFLLRDRRRLRARLDDDCPTLDFYGGFYLQSDDDRVCAKRDEIRNRVGQSCRIERFRLMVPSAG